MSSPERIGRFRVLGLLGRGAMGIVYRGRDEAIERDVAIKVMSAGVAATKDDRARFLREARAAAKLQHPNIVTIYELGEHEGAPYMALEFLEGLDLAGAIERGLRPDPTQTLPIVLQLLAGLAQAHSHGIVHRDVKPSNVFLPFGLPAKVMDFGVARLAGSTTAQGIVVGTPNYMSPEQARGMEVDARSDLFSAGLILYELVTGEKAYRADSVVSVLYKIVHEEPDLSLLPRGPEWASLRSVVDRALARLPEERYSDASEMASDLQAALHALGGSPETALAHVAYSRPTPQPVVPTRPPGPAPGKRSALPAVFGGLGAFALAGGVAAWLYLRPSPASDAPAGVPSPAGTPAPASLSPVPSAKPRTAEAPRPQVSLVLPPLPSPTTVASPAASPSAPIESPPAPAAPSPSAPSPKGPPSLAEAKRLREVGSLEAALAEVRAVMAIEPTADAKALAQAIEAEFVVEQSFQAGLAALRRGDKDAALEEVKKGLAVKPSEPRLLELFRQATQ